MSAPDPRPVTITTNILGQTGLFNLTPAGVLATAITLSSPDGKVQLSLKANTTVTIPGQSLRITIEVSPPSPPANTKLIAAYKFAPSGSSFRPAVTITIKYDPAALPVGVTEPNLYIAYWDGGKWSELPSTVDTKAKNVIAQTSHFTIFALLDKTAPPPPPPPPPPPVAMFVISDKVTIGDRSGSFKVTVPEPTPGWNWLLIGVLAITGLAIIIALIVILLRQRV